MHKNQPKKQVIGPVLSFMIEARSSDVPEANSG